MKYVLLTLCILSSMAGCIIQQETGRTSAIPSIEDTTTINNTTGNSSIPIIQTDIPPSKVNFTVENISRTDITANDDGYQDWQDWQTRSVAVLLVSDGEKAARVVLPEGRSVYLQTNPPVNVTILALKAGQAYLSVDKEQAFIDEDADKMFHDGKIIVFVGEILIRG